MSVVTEKREIVILPTEIKKDLIKEIGNILVESTNTMSSYELQYRIISPNKDILSHDFEHFLNLEWPDRIDTIFLHVAQTGMGPVQRGLTVNIKLNEESHTSTIQILGQSPTWVDGVTKGLERIIDKNKFWYFYIPRYNTVRLLLSSLLWISISYALNYIYNKLLVPMLNFGAQNMLGIFLFLGIIFIPSYIKSMIEWFFPWFEYGNQFPQKQIRRVIWGLLTSSGIISIIIERFF